MIVGAIMLAALAHQARENQTQVLARLIAWDRQRRQALRRQLPARQARPAQDQVTPIPRSGLAPGPNGASGTQ